MHGWPWQAGLAGGAVLLACLLAAGGIAGSVKPSYPRIYLPTATPPPTPVPTFAPSSRAVYRTLDEAAPRVPFPLPRPRTWRDALLAGVIVSHDEAGRVVLVQQRYSAPALEGDALSLPAAGLYSAPADSPASPSRLPLLDATPIEVTLYDGRTVPGRVGRRGDERWLTWEADGIAHALAVPPSVRTESHLRIAADFTPGSE